MNKKQAGIIVTLLALIVCAGILAAKVNGPLEVAGNGFGETGGILTFHEKQDDKVTSDYFSAKKDAKEQNDTQTLASYKTIIDDTDVKEEAKSEATKQFTELTMALNHEENIEHQLKGKGFDDAICYLENANNKARIIIKSSEKELTQQQGKIIRDVVYSIAQISTVEVELKE